MKCDKCKRYFSKSNIKELWIQYTDDTDKMDNMILLILCPKDNTNFLKLTDKFLKEKPSATRTKRDSSKRRRLV